MAGTGAYGYTGDGGPATNATFGNGLNSVSMVEGEESEYYIADIGNYVVRKIDKNGIITTIAGTGHQGFSGDGGPATQADLNLIFHIYYHQGSVFIIESFTNRIREITPAGIIRTVVGNGTAGYSPDGTPAVDAMIDGPTGLGFNKSGELFFGDTNNQMIRKINRLGQLVTVAGSKNPISNQDGTIATSANIDWPSDMAVRDDGTVFWREAYDRIRYVATDGTMQTIAGNTQHAMAPSGTFAKDAPLSSIRQFDFSPEGDLYLTEESNHRIVKISDPINANPDADGFYRIPSTDGSEIYYFDSNGIHTKTTYGATDAIKYEFLHDSSNNLIGIKDGFGNLTVINRDGQGNALNIVSPYGQATNFAYDSQKRLSQLQLPNGDAYHMTYLSNGLLSSFQKPTGGTSIFSYDDSGKLLKDQDAAGGFTALQNIINAASMSVQTTSAEGVTQTREQSENGTQTVVTSSLSTGEQVSLTTSDTTIAARSSTGSMASSSSTNEQRLGAPAVFNSSISRTEGNTRRETYARTYGRLNSIADYQWTEVQSLNSVLRKTTSYDSATQVFSSVSAMGRAVVTQLDEKMHPLSTQTGNLTPMTFQYDSHGRLISTTSGARVTNISYGTNGMPNSLQDALGNVTRFEYDQNLRKVKTIYPNGRESDYQYDGNNNIISITPAGKPSHTMNFNLVDLLTSYLPPSLGGINTATTYQYNLDKKVKLVQRPDGQQISMNYESSTGLLSEVQTPSGSYNFTYNLGRLASATSPDGVRTDVGYWGSILTSEAISGPIYSQMYYTLNSALQVDSMYAGGVSINFGYDGDELVTSAGNENLSYDSNSLVSQISLGSVVQSNSYNSYGELSNTTGYYSSAPIFSQNITRDDNGRIISLAEGADTINYSYDNLGRLTDVNKNGAAVGHYEYDDNGNRTSASIRGQIFSGVYDDQDRLTSYGTKTYSYNNNGDLVSVANSADSTTKLFVYDVFGNLKQANVAGKTMTYLVDAKNRRVGKKVNGLLSQAFVYQNQTNIAAELDGNSNLVSRFIYASKSNVPDYMIKNGSVYRIISDSIGSVRVVVDVNTGAYAQLIKYDEFGQVLSDSNPGFQPFGFAGGIYDRDTGLVRFGARAYDPESGRWISKDPILFAGGDTNLYSYSLQDPINRIDSNGLDSHILLVPMGSMFMVPGHAVVAISEPGKSGMYRMFDLTQNSIRIYNNGVVNENEVTQKELDSLGFPISSKIQSAVEDQAEIDRALKLKQDAADGILMYDLTNINGMNCIGFARKVQQ